ncbi:MAG TPA: adenosyl-hopene transferase HpnH [Thermodesulfobacteriota bacterium]|nr:adenosyl-hopene transferase HpnH [Thermodesulfobacteriota bacterium]
MGVPFIQKYRIGQYVLGQKLRGNRRYPLVLMLEPLFRCNLSCVGCGKVGYPEEVLNRQLSIEECFRAVEECGAPVVSIAGGEPLIHPDMPQIVAGLVKRKRFVYLCTNGLLLKSHLHDFQPSSYLSFSIHLDGFQEQHDALTGRPGVFDQAIEAIRLIRSGRFRFIINCTLYEGVTAKKVSEFFDFVLGLGAEGITLSPGYSYADATRKELFLQRTRSRQLFREVFKLGKRRKWKFNQSSLFLDFLAGNQSYRCTPWGNPTRNVLGWQRPCYLLADGYAPSFRELLGETDWSRFGPGRHPQCTHCMLHSGFEATAVNDTLAHPFKALSVFLRGPGTDGPFAPDPAENQGDEP